MRPNVKWPDVDKIAWGTYFSGDIDEQLILAKRVKQKQVRQKSEALVESITFKKGKALSPDERKVYVVREVVMTKNIGSMQVHAARTLDDSFKRTAGVYRFMPVIPNETHKNRLDQLVQRVTRYSKVARYGRFLPQIDDIVDQSPDAVWVVSQWIKGLSLAQLSVKSRGFHRRETRVRLAGLMENVCEAVACLHEDKLPAYHITPETIIVSEKPKGAFLIDPIFLGLPELVQLETLLFEPVKDVKQVAAVFNNLLTQGVGVSSFKTDLAPLVSIALAEIIEQALHLEIEDIRLLKDAFASFRRDV